MEYYLKLRSFITITHLLLTLCAAIMLAKGNFGISPTDIARIASTRIGYNPDVMQSLSRQHADTKVGFYLLVGAFLFQAIDIFLAKPYMGETASSLDKWGVVVSIAFCLLIFVLGFWYSKYRAEMTFQESKIIADSFQR